MSSYNELVPLKLNLLQYSAEEQPPTVLVNALYL
jgi:hypothetical protein